MKITSFHPMIITHDAEETVKVFEALGFRKKHNPSGESATGNLFNTFAMEDDNDFHVDVVVSTGHEGQDTTGIRMNVRDFDEAVELLKAHGFKSITGDNATTTGSAKADYLVSPSGFGISLVEHIRK